MKKSIIILLFACGITQAQTRQDSAMARMQAQINHVQLNLDRAHQIYTNGVYMHGVGLWADIMAITGYQTEFFDKKSMNGILLIGGVFHLAGAGFMIYSHKYIGRASLKVSAKGLTYNF